MNGINNAYMLFCEDIKNNYKILNNSIELYEDKKIRYEKNLHYKIIEGCFVEMFNSWEFFLENSFISYLLGYEDLDGKQYNCCVRPKNESHAYDIIKGTKSFPKWTDIKETVCLSNLYFDDLSPFSCLESNPIELKEIKDIRNFISHKSEKSKRSFKNVLINNLGTSSEIGAGEFLMKFKKGEKITYFTFYEEVLMFYVEEICNVSK